jgi:hypothetical protein
LNLPGQQLSKDKARGEVSNRAGVAFSLRALPY